MRPMTKITLKALSSIDLNIKKNYRFYRKVQKIIKAPAKLPYGALDHKIMVGEREIPIRVFMPEDGSLQKLILFFHGGGWVIGDIDSYTPVCLALAKELKQAVISVDYRLAPEHPFPKGLTDCYHVLQEMVKEADVIGIHPDDITLIGDSAGGNLAAAVSLLARNKGTFVPKRQVLLYPATYHDHSPSSPYTSIHENGEDFILTTKRIEEYMDLYVPLKKERRNPYVAPLLAENHEHLPTTLIITAQYDPLRDEGLDYGEKLRAAGNTVRSFTIKDAIHGYMGTPLAEEAITKTHTLIKLFLQET
ncbi:MAG TPA: alpha/beta hydrolase [Clostridiaceae bacterium]|nr:alpha/beta hydrolase [Clostridiaceae bacterium]